MRQRWSTLGTYAVLGVAGFLAVFYRLPEWSRYRLWKEDGSVFLDQALGGSFAGAWFHGYGGYLHLFPRVMSSVVTAVVPIEHYPLAVAAAMAACTSAAGLAVYHFSGTLLRTPVARLLVWALLVVAPSARMEVVLAMADFQWYLLCACFWALLARRAHWGTTVVASLVFFAAFTSSVFSLAFLPLLLIRALWFRTRHDVVPAVVGAVAGVLQAAVMAGADRGADDQPGYDGLPSPVRLAGHYLAKAVDTAWFGPGQMYARFAHHPGLWLTAGAVALAFMAWGAWRVRRTHVVAVAALVVSVVYFAAAFTLSGTWRDAIGSFDFDRVLLARYWFFAAFLVGCVIAALVDAALSARPRRRLIVAGAVVLAAAQVYLIVSNYTFYDVRAMWLRDTPEAAAQRDGLAYIPDWSVALQRARAECAEPGAMRVYLYGNPDSKIYDQFTAWCSDVVK